MRVLPVVLGVITAAVAIGCSSAESAEPALTDEQLAREMSQTVYGKPIEDAKAGPAEMQAASVDLADRICSLLRSSADAEIISTDTMYEGNELGVRSLLESMQNEAAWTARQSMDGLQISAKYKCAEFSPMLRVYEAAHGPTQ